MNNERQALGAALGKIPSGLFVVTAQRGNETTGLLASWIQQCSFDPPRISLAVRNGRPVLDWLSLGSRCVVNVIAEGQPQLVAHFGKGFAPGEAAFAGLAITSRADAPPILTDALAHLDCRVVARYAAGDHELLLVDVVAGAVHRDGLPTVHLRADGFRY